MCVCVYIHLKMIPMWCQCVKPHIKYDYNK